MYFCSLLVPPKAFTSGLLEVLRIPVLWWNHLTIPLFYYERAVVLGASPASSPADLTGKGILGTYGGTCPKITRLRNLLITTTANYN